MKNISSDSLFHYTRSLNVLQSILENGIYPFYSYEKMFGDLQDIRDFLKKNLSENANVEDFFINDIAIPMICFCDIRISKTSEHTNNYGEFAIGVKKEWRIKYNLTPVIYKESNSALNFIIDDLLVNLLINHSKNTNCVEYQKNLRDIFFELSYFIKPFRGKKWNKSNLEYDDKTIQFYEEREWRYVPLIRELKEKNVNIPPPMLLPKYYKKNEDLELFNKGLKKNFTLSIKNSDITHLIVDNEQNETELSKFIIHHNKFKEDDKLNLIRKITSFERIRKDY